MASNDSNETRTYKKCTGWVNAGQCSDLYPETAPSTCDDVISPSRTGLCLCHDDTIKVGLPCNHGQTTCDEVCDDALKGCKRPEQLAKIFKMNEMVACDGSWLVPGPLAAEQNACNVDAGWEICSVPQTFRLDMKADECSSISGENKFYMTGTHLFSSPLIVGCGNPSAMQNHQLPLAGDELNLTPFSLALSEFQFSAANSSWRFDSTQPSFLDGIYKINDENGGVLCCRKQTTFDKQHVSSTRAVSMAFQSAVMLILVAMIFYMVMRLLLAFIQSIFRTRTRCICCRGWDGTIVFCNRYRIPLTRFGLQTFHEEKSLLKLECRAFSQFSDEDIISHDSAHCNICLDDYCAEQKVMLLRCQHHFHEDCAKQWLLEHHLCPICRQDYKDAVDQHNDVGAKIETTEIELQAVDLELAVASA